MPQAARTQCCSGLLLASFVLLLAARDGRAQRIASASGYRISDAAPNGRTGPTAGTVGGERVNGSALGPPPGLSHVVGGKVAGYGRKQVLGTLGETAYRGSSAGFDPGTDFPQTDFVATMPGPVFPKTTASSTGPSANGFGLAPTTSQVRTFDTSIYGLPSISSASPASTRRIPASHLKNPDAILEPFTHPLGASRERGLGKGPDISLPAGSISNR